MGEFAQDASSRQSDETVVPKIEPKIPKNFAEIVKRFVDLMWNKLLTVK